MHRTAKLLSFDQARVRQYADMLQNCRQRDGERLGQVACRLRAALRELHQHCASRWIGERREGPIESVDIKVNHMV